MPITLVRDDAREQRSVETGTTGLDLYGDDRTVVDVELRDLSRELADGAVVEPVLVDSTEHRGWGAGRAAAHPP